MKMSKQLFIRATVLVAACVIVDIAMAQHAANVASYSAGATPAPGGYTNPSVALGEPARITGTGMFDGVVSPFNPPFRNTHIVSVGEGGHLTLRLSHYAIPDPTGPEIGIFENFGLVDTDFPNGQAGNPAGGFGAPDAALVEVSANGTSWVSLGNVVFDVPSNGYADATAPFATMAGSVPADFQKPFLGSLASFNGLKYFDAANPDILDLLAGSGGGKWIDISASGLAEVGFVRFSLADDGSSSTSLNFEIDGVAVAHAALGGVVVPEPATILACGLALLLPLVTRRRLPVE